MPVDAVIRNARAEDAEAMSALAVALAPYFLADPDDAEAARPFFATVTPEAFRERLSGNRYRYHVAAVGAALAGVVGVRDRSHLYHLFVAERFHGRGLGARLWATAKRTACAEGNPGRFTVNASRYAVPVYERFGFSVTGPEMRTEGMIFIPMVLDTPDRLADEAG